MAERWAREQDWQIQQVAFRSDVLSIIALGRPLEADIEPLRAELDAAGLGDVDVR